MRSTPSTPVFPIQGNKPVAQLRENIDATGITLSGEVVDAINAIHARLPDPGQ